MLVAQAKAFVGQTCEVTWTDRNGNRTSETVSVDDVTFVPMYGACMLTSSGDIRLDRVVEISAVLLEAA